ncbi:AfsR/SARP family transcriptional regulator [Stackebrandtia nassauensis]|uniref:Transcriptional regulator, SARP family n=1 Tax=Stackebrandtia nassauensis (strain DSM 44728 / CIP 108903 / NRRL B-16338 / NBRC 102104 / LLR-40K-21) TaxID=446470 RepID=D3QAI8_STANL|nr:AfsR/SARP family transcriptional regulator [Stackebrandtia nassauensis]ADD42771.1 transcriptional regulator, SARP family [Stackebrandtia nassauensis DSM 44728]
MDIRLLGSVEVRVGDVSVALGGPKQAGLFTLIALHRNETVSIDRIVEATWQGAPPSGVRGQIQVYVSNLRRALAEAGGDRDRIQTRRSGYTLCAEAEEIDLARFEALTAEAREALRQGRLDTASALLRDALALWRGDAFEDIRVGFAEAEAARLEAMRLAALGTRLIVDLALGRCAEVAAESQALVRTYPLHEGLWARLMLALHCDGRSAEALDTYRRARTVLRSQVGMEPGPELRNVASLVWNGEPGEAQIARWTGALAGV